MKRNRRSEKMTFLCYYSRTYLFGWEHLYFRYLRIYVNFCYGVASADAPVKGTILTLTTQSLTLYNCETCRVDDLIYSAACDMSNCIPKSICL